MDIVRKPSFFLVIFHFITISLFQNKRHNSIKYDIPMYVSNVKYTNTEYANTQIQSAQKIQHVLLYVLRFKDIK